MASRKRAVPESGSARQRSRTVSIRDRYAARRPVNSGDPFIARGRGGTRSSVHRGGLVLGPEGLDLGAVAPFQQDLDLLLRGLQRALAMARQLHAPLEGLERVLERQIAALQALHQAFELSQGLFEIGGFALNHLRSRARKRSDGKGVTLHSVANEGQINCKQFAVDVPEAQAYSRSPIVRPSLSEESVVNLKGSKTEKNLKDAFAGESQANRRYLYFAAKADVEGFNDVSTVFRSTAEGETGHAHGHLEYLEAVGDPATGLPIGETKLNLKAAIAGETHEYTDMYPGMAKAARDEGFAEIADWFETLAKAERSHANRFQKALDAI